jgi:hypothetical protein
MIKIRDGLLRIWMRKKVGMGHRSLADKKKRCMRIKLAPRRLDENRKRWSPENMVDKKPTDDLEVSLLLPAACVYSRLALCSCCSQYCLSTTNKNNNHKVPGCGVAKWRCSVVKSVAKEDPKKISDQ